MATAISSYLGRSGQNIRSVFDYAKAQPSILFLDELDAIAKRRDDTGDLGELKRLVNVLLKEIEEYPVMGVIVGATNHPELLDKAIWRRFDRTLVIEMPELLDEYVDVLENDTIDYISLNAAGINSADICKLCNHIKRQLILNPETHPKIIALAELFKINIPKDKNEKIKICSNLKHEFPRLSQRDISQITHIPLTSVSRYLAIGKKEG